jgi:tetratricopeptide (TPR) repeat protein
MKRFWSLIICAAILFQLQAQSNSIDSLRNLLGNTKDDTTEVKLLLAISHKFERSKPDSVIIYAEQALKISKHFNYSKGELSALNLITSAYTTVGDYSTALDKAFEKLDRAEELNDKYDVGLSYNDIARIYDSQGDWERSIEYLIKKLELAKEINDEGQLNTSLLNIGNSYLNQSIFDSARIYINQALEIALRRKDTRKIGACYLNLGMIYTGMKLYDLAKNYLHLSITYFEKDDDYFINYAQFGLAVIFDSTGRFDSSFYYSRESYQRAVLSKSPDNIFYPVRQLVSLFRKMLQPDSALFYQDILIQIKDSLTNQEKQKRIQNITFQRELKQMEKDKQKQYSIDEHKRNLQIAGVAVFLPLFFGFVLLLSRRQIKPRAVDFLGILFLLFVFEFITLYFHPIIGKWTHESPIWMLLIFVAIAFILVPLHHRSENWIKKQLVLQRTKELQKRVRMGEEAQKKLGQ